MMTPSRWAFAAVLLFALVTAGLIFLRGPAPEPAVPLHDGFRTPVLALEFAGRADDLDFLEGEAGAAMRTHIRRVQRIDAVLPLAYAGMAAALFLGLALRGRFLAAIGIGLALATIPADWQENATIGGILDEIENPVCNADTIPQGEGPRGAGPRGAPAGRVVLRDCLGEAAFENVSPALEIASFAFDSFLPVRVEFLREDRWTKWALIAAQAVLLALILWFDGRPVWHDGRRILAVPPVLAALAITVTWASGANGHVAEIMSILLIPFLLTFPVAAVMYFLGQNKGARKKRARQPQVEENP